MAKSGVRYFLRCLLPCLHLCGCLGIWIARSQVGLDYLFFIDFPVSGLLFGMSYIIDRPILLYGVFGTLWWFLLSRGAEILGTRALRVFRRSRQLVQ